MEAIAPISLVAPTPTPVTSHFSDDVRTPSSPSILAALPEEVPDIILGDSPPMSPPAAEPIPVDLNVAAPEGNGAVPVVAVSKVVVEEDVSAVSKDSDLDMECC
ncbi:unnamed protein product [Calypogeia fissa]